MEQFLALPALPLLVAISILGMFVLRGKALSWLGYCSAVPLICACILLPRSFWAVPFGDLAALMAAVPSLTSFDQVVAYLSLGYILFCALAAIVGILVSLFGGASIGTPQRAAEAPASDRSHEKTNPQKENES